ncbi:hypothetical protein EYR27_02485 [Xanthomonas oryzae]|nr:hypothetical protein EYR27_02485 [Xanthomonas oryzae]
MICSSEKRFFTSSLLGIGNWTPNRCATQTRGEVVTRTTAHRPHPAWWRRRARTTAGEISCLRGSE